MFESPRNVAKRLDILNLRGLLLNWSQVEVLHIALFGNFKYFGHSICKLRKNSTIIDTWNNAVRYMCNR